MTDDEKMKAFRGIQAQIEEYFSNYVFIIMENRPSNLFYYESSNYDLAGAMIEKARRDIEDIIIDSESQDDEVEDWQDSD